MKPLADYKGVLKEEPDYYGEKSFCGDANIGFPEMAQHDSSLHGTMAALASLARSAIEAENLALLQRLFTFLEGILSRPKLHPELENAVTISFLLPIDFQRSVGGREAWGLLPERLKHVVQHAV